MKLKGKRIAGIVISAVVVSGCVMGHMTSQEVSASKASDVNRELSIQERFQGVRKEVHTSDSNKEYEEVRVVVNLKSDSVAEKTNDAISDYNSELKSKEDKILNKQDEVIKKAEEITGNKVVNRSAYLVNSFSIDTTREKMDDLEELDGVDCVYESSTYTVHMDKALDDASVEEEWNDNNYGYTGEGTIVAVLDTGVNYEHKDMVLGTGVKTKYSANEWKEKIQLLGYGAYKTDKVPFAYNYATGENDCLADGGNFISKLLSSPFHGYHVAGIATANGEIKGVAKNAQVLGMKVIGDNNSNSTIDGIIKAIEDAVKLGADVINMSLGINSVAVNDSELLQKTVTEATNAGVVCCISAANSGTSSSQSGGATNELDRKDTSTVHTPAVTKSALTIAASTNEKKNEKIGMASFSSWGPSNELDIKPELTAPGQDIKATLDGIDKYSTMSGTSMASPFAAGCSAVLVEATRAKNLGLTPNELSLYLKNNLMNTAKVVTDSYKNPYSVRYQGAGLVNIYDAVKNNVIATCNGNAKVELREINNNITNTFKITLKNYGSTDTTYNLSEAQIYTDYTKNTGFIHQYRVVPVDGAKVTFNTNKVTVPANGSIDVTGTVQLGSKFETNQYVEAFIKFTGENAVDLGLPLLAFYGDWSAESAIDAPVYENGNRLIQVADGTGLTEVYNGTSDHYYGRKYKLVDKKRTALNRNNTNEIEERLQKEAANVDMDDLSEEQVDEIVKSIGDIIKDDENEDKEGFLSKLKDLILKGVFINENEEHTLKNILGGYSAVVYKSKFDGYLNINANVPFSNMSVVKVNAFLLGYSNVLESNVIGNFNKNIAVDKGAMYVFIFNKLYDYDSSEEFGRITVKQANSATTQEIETYFDKNEVAFSPNKDGIGDEVIPCAINLRSAKETAIYVVDSNNNKVRELGTNIPTAKYFYSAGANNALLGNAQPFLYDFMRTDFVKWDGMLYDGQSGKYVKAPEGQYYIQIESKIKSDSMPQVVKMPIKVDYEKPTLKSFSVTKEGTNTIMTFSASDNVGISPHYYVDIDVKQGNDSKNITFSQLYVETETNSKGEYVLNLGNIGESNITCMIEDQAGNQIMSTTVSNK
ncbi:MAG: hypothetical protein E7262_02920 [Lachnospiraceae bacterium]|nr:hypothetical protein [Lachnospiraceae bacterium]